MLGKKKAALATAEKVLTRYWDGSLPVNVRHFVEREGIDIHYFENISENGKWHAENETIALRTNLTEQQERLALAKNFGLACSLDDEETFAEALLLPEKPFTEALVERKLSLKQIAGEFHCDYETCAAWAESLRERGKIKKNTVLW